MRRRLVEVVERDVEQLLRVAAGDHLILEPHRHEVKELRRQTRCGAARGVVGRSRMPRGTRGKGGVCDAPPPAPPPPPQVAGTGVWGSKRRLCGRAGGRALSMLDSLSRMMDECASLSKICRVDCMLYTSCPRKSSAMNFGLYMVRITSWSTARAGGREGEGRRRVWQWVVGRGWGQGRPGAVRRGAVPQPGASVVVKRAQLRGVGVRLGFGSAHRALTYLSARSAHASAARGCTPSRHPC